MRRKNATSTADDVCRQQPHCTVNEGFAHLVACMMAAEACWSGKKQYWDAAGEAVVDQTPRA